MGEQREEERRIIKGGEKCGKSREGIRKIVSSVKGLREMVTLYQYPLKPDLPLWKHCYGILNLLREVISFPQA